jgi:hypothetical protein
MSEAPFETSSFEKFNYALRPAKNVERKMFCEAFARLSRIEPLPSFQYIGFGAVGFHDFCLFHERLGIRNMLSIEGNLNTQERIEKNIPYSCIRMKWGLSNDILPQLEWVMRTILWLDYERPISKSTLEDIRCAVSNMRSGSVIVLTLPVDPGQPSSTEGAQSKRMNDLERSVGKERITSEMREIPLAKWGLASVTRKIVLNEIVTTLLDRNAPQDDGARIVFRQLFNFHYADGMRMMTVGGVLLDEADRARMGDDHFNDLEFYRNGSDAYLIESPVLTLREIAALNAMLPGSLPDVPELVWIPEAERIRYGKVYRYYPSFSEVES